MSDFLWPCGLYSPWNSPDQNTGVGSLLGVLPNRGIKPRSPTLQADSLPAELSGKPLTLKGESFPPWGFGPLKPHGFCSFLMPFCYFYSIFSNCFRWEYLLAVNCFILPKCRSWDLSVFSFQSNNFIWLFFFSCIICFIFLYFCCYLHYFLPFTC